MFLTGVGQCPQKRRFLFAKPFLLRRVGVPRGELAEPWGFPSFSSEAKNLTGVGVKQQKEPWNVYLEANALVLSLP